jgi:hypothetical protein
VWFTGQVPRRWAAALLLSLVPAALAVSSAPTAASAADRHQPVRVTFVLRPTWLPSGFSVSGGGYISPPGGLRVYPYTGVAASLFTTGANEHPRPIPVLFTLDYYGFHNPESKNITLLAEPTKLAGVLPARPNTTLARRKVSVSSYKEGALHNLNVDISWIEDGDAIDVTTQGLPVVQAEQFVEGLVRGAPPRHVHPIPPATTTTATSATAG